MRITLIPRETKFFDMFVEDAHNVLGAARLLEQLFRNYDDRERLASQLRDAEHAGDQISHEIGHKLESTFVTPFDREDIHGLISRLDDILDFIEAPTDTARAQAEIITRQCEQLAEALTKLRTFKGLEQHWIEVHRLENEGDRIARQAVAELFKHGQETMDVIKWKDVYALLEKAIDACEDAANVIERIVVKHA